MNTPTPSRTPFQTLVITLAGLVLAAIGCCLLLALIEALTATTPLTDLLQGIGVR